MKVYTDVQCFYGPWDISGEANKFEGNTEVEIKESRVFNQSTIKRDPGLYMMGGTLSGVADSVDGSDIARVATSSEVTGGLVGVLAPISVHLAQNPAAEGDLTIISNAIHAGNPNVTEQGELDEFSVDLKGDDPAVLGYCLANGNKTSSGNGSGVQVGAAASGQTIYAVLHAYGATSGTIDVVIESDDNAGFTSATTRFTFSQVTTSTTYEFLTLAGPVTDDYWRANWTSASTPDHDISVSMGIL